ncbi:phage tail protein [Moraxella nasibovis]|uniref:TipJ family phage tail tip protein n=1 Tax=Moraxella nasibovis TaxID=2904120 RepID=UPI002410354B|nr:phage tail protein [Moraxella nasibovis]WFF39306.1 phage tail protein [Moraxella nasibovis]
MHIHGAKKQKGGGQKPHIAPDDLVATSYANIMYGLAEGEIMGLADGGKSIRLDGTPLINDNGQPNFTNVNWDFRTGTLDQTHIAGFPAVENETNVGVELRSDRPWVKAINNRELSAVRVRLNFNALREQDDSGNIKGYAISYAIDVQTDGGSFVEVLTDTVRGKASQGYKKSHRIDLPNAGTAKRWTIRVRRITPNRNSDLIADTVHIDALTEIIDAKLAYPATALLSLSYDAKTFSNIAKIAVRLKGKIIQVPTNYDPIARTYTGLWDGTFKMAYSNNPAWVFYDLCTHKRYGLGERLAGMVDKWRLYQIGQYCDELVDDGKGGQEPRFTCNVYIQKADDAYRVLQNLASVFRGLSFWDGANIIVDSDTPKEPVYTFSPANVVGGEFAYTGTRQRDRHTLTKVAWDNPENGFSTEYELIPDEAAIARYGVKVLDIAAFGCTSQGQAQRAGLWALKAEQLETQTVSFKTGLMGFIPQVGQIINVADNVFAGRAISGKIVNVSTNKRVITLDRVAGKVGDTLIVNGTDGAQSAKISAVRGQVLTLDKPINAEPEHIWAVISDDLKLKQFRILTIAQNDDATFDITALEYNAQKYAVVDTGAVVVPQPYTVLNATPITAPNSVTLSANTRTHQGQAVTTLTINWEQVTGATAYIVEWRKDDGNWQTLPKVSGQSMDIDGVYAGNYQARVRAVDAFDNESLATSSQLTNIAGKVGKPPRLARLVIKGLLFGMELGWIFNAGSDDTNFTEIQVSPDGRSNIATLGTFAYPTNKHEITGLQGNLTQFYRGRIVDKLGNTSDWTDWVSGTTSADADKVLNLISGQINQSHLDQTLRTPIAKIGGLESAVNAVNSQLPQLNQQIATAMRDIGTERSRITGAIRDIGTLQTANNAKTQELANLTQTVGGHTSSIRELGVTTGDLSQKYTALKSASDTANSEITAIKQTQSGQATTINRLNSEMNGKASTADLTAEQQARADADGALGQRISAIDTAYKKSDTDITARLAREETARATGDAANSQAIRTLESGLGGKANATALNNYYTKAQTDEAISGRVERFEASLKRQEINAVTDLNTLTTQGQYFIKAGNNPNAPATNWLFVDVETSNDQWIVMQTVRQDNNAKNQWVRQRHNGNWSAWEKVATGSELNDKANATALNDLSARVTQVDGRITAEAQKVSHLQTTVGGQTASIRSVEQSVNGVRAIKAVTVDNNGFISGYGLMSELQNGRVTSRFGINADQIYFGATTSAKKPFVFTTRTTTIDGVSYPAGAWLNSASIANASITNAHIANATITSAKIANGAIDNAKIANGAIDSAKIGEAAITTAKIGVAQVDTLQIAGEAVISPRYQETDWGSQYQAGVEHTVLRFTMNTQGSAVCLLFGWKKILASAWHQSSATVIIKIKRDDLVLHEDGFSFSSAWNSANSNQSSPPIFDFNPPNNPVYTVVISYHGDRPSVRAEGIRILGLAIKR